MNRNLPLPRFRLDIDSITEHNHINTRTTSAPSSLISTYQPQRSQIRTRQSPCSDLQSTTIPEEYVYNGNHHRASLSINPSSQSTKDVSKISLDNQKTSKGDNIKLRRQSWLSLHGSLDKKKTSSSSSSSTTSLKLSDNHNHNKKNDDVEEEEEEDDDEEDDEYGINYQPPRRPNYRYSLPDASPAALALRNILKRNKTNKSNRFGIGLPSDSSHSLSTFASTNFSSPLSTFRNFFSLVKLPSTKSTHSATSRHSSLTTLTNTTGNSLTTLDQTTSFNSPTVQWYFETDKSQWCSSDGISKIILGSIELHNLTYVEHKQLKHIVLQRLQSSQYDLGVSIHEPKDAKSNGNVFGVALSQCVNDDDSRLQDELISTSVNNASGINRKDSTDIIDISINDEKISPSGSISSTYDSGCSISPASPSSLHISDSDYEQSKFRSVSLEALGPHEAAATTSGMNRMKTLRCYPAKVPELIRNCCDYLEKNALQTVGLFRVGVSKKRLKELKDQVNSNRSLTFDSTTNVHDIAGLMKEFLRELPEPLLTRDLCGALLNIRTKLHPKDQSRALSYLISLLPSSNRDTLYTLLKFLYHISMNSQDRYSTDGKVLVAGNKMDSANLAIVFAPTILMDGKAPILSNKDTSVAMTTDQMEQGKSILKMMIEQYKELFMVPKDLHDEVCVALYEEDSAQLLRALAFKVQKGCGITSMELDDANEQLFMSLDVTPITCEMPNSAHSIFAALNPRMNQQQLIESTPRRYNLRRNSDFPCSSAHTSRSSEFLQVPMSSSQQRLTNPKHQSLSKLPRIRDIREATIDQIIFRVVDPQSLSSRPSEPIINISLADDVSTTSSTTRPDLPDVKESLSPSITPPPPTTTTTTPSSSPLLREIKSYSRSKTAPLSSASGAPHFLTPKHCEARDLCGSSSNDDSPAPKTGHSTTPV
ncbi:unnamed protein product [Adineta steineri]|uniref:Rho-GAP domain-containing protein n=1 Tax=Adineta steineri TaxID=433720 RepID=A0A818N553_9BILA|nr:unnamed protein product [Adineta steineri]CAF3600555.1 unnamed protein product [Adineta steineri]